METGFATLWMVFALVLVLSMQAGFLMLEGGRVRSKNSINVAQKNITDLVVVWMVFMVGGFAVMFGISIDELASGQAMDYGVTPVHFMYQVAFCGTTATILSGAVAERLSFRCYLGLVAVISMLIYPIVGRMVWGDSYNSEVNAWLANLGFMDFAGGTVVHGVGAWVGLAAIVFIGPRLGRFDDNGNPQAMPAHNSVIALFGVFILMFGWLGFNGGSIAPQDPLLIQVLFNTMTNATFGGFAGMMVGAVLDKGVFNPARVTSGLIGGLVCGTAGINLMSVFDAMIIGALGGAAATWFSHVLLYKFKLDDPLDVVATHGVAGVLGTLAVPFVAPAGALALGSRLAQFGAQLVGVVATFVFCSAVTWVALSLLKRVMEVRVSAESEKVGLNYTEHGESIGVGRLQRALHEKMVNSESFADGILVDADDEHSELASTLNTVIKRYEDASDKVAQSSRRFRHFAETATDWLWETDENLRVTFIHSSSANSVDVPLDATVGLHLLELIHLGPGETRQILACFDNEEATPVFEAELVVPGDVIEPFAVEIRGVPNRNADDVLTGFRGTLTDISVRKTAEDKALYLAVHDELTGLPNRRALSENLKADLRKADREGTAVIVAGVDLDGFKAVNDAYGHLVGDKLLKLVAARLSNFLRPQDAAYRTGGDEFVIVFNGWEPASALELGANINRHLIRKLSAPYLIQNLEVRIGVSIGLSAYPEHSRDVLELLRLADLALYHAKGEGKGRVSCFEQIMDADAKLQLELEQDLHNAIEQEEFHLMYQPQVDATTEKVTGYEALLRWNHPERGEIQPSDFIAVAEKLKIMDKIGAYVLDKACEFAATWQTGAGEDTPRLSVNVSPLQFRNKDFYTLIVDTITKHNLPPERLELEITEDVLVHDFAEVSQVLAKLKSLGVSVAVDDFGSGQTSLRYLNQFPLSTIKIDRSFIQHLAVSPKAAEITRTIVLLGRKLGINVLAEGVEKTAQLDLLKEWRCDEVQGFIFAKPMFEKDVTELMQRGTAGTQDKAA